MTRILGIDPGSRITGFGIIDAEAGQVSLVECGPLRVEAEGMPQRLKNIFEAVTELCERYQPAEFAIEDVFMSKNAASALKLGQARGAAICAAMMHGLPVAEYSPTEIKQAVVGTGRADKQQVQHMVKLLLNIEGNLQSDAADAVAIAITHHQTSNTLKRFPQIHGARSGRWR